MTDLRLQGIPPGTRTRPLLKTDCPVVAEAICQALRGQATVMPSVVKGLSLMWITGAHADIPMHESDWQKIRHLFEDGTFDPQTVPAFQRLDKLADPLYQRVLGSLLQVYTDDFPYKP